MYQKQYKANHTDIDMHFWYNANGHLAAVEYFNNINDTWVLAYALTNSMGDVIGLYYGNGNLVTTYEYDAWGNLVYMNDTSALGIGTLNPIRYRSYYYDSDTGFYYCQSRYYNPQVGRWLNADSQLNGATLLGCNLFAYCENNAINYSDPDGRSLIGAILLGVTVFGMIIACSSSNVSPEHVTLSKANRKPGKTPPSSWPPLPDELGGKKPTWNPEGYWEGKEGDLTWDNRSHGSGVDRGNGAQDGHWDDENSNRRWDKEGNPLGSKAPAYTVPTVDYSSEFQIGVTVTAATMFVVGVIYLFYTGDPTVLQQATS